VPKTLWVSKIGSLRIIACLVRKYTFQYQNLLTKRVVVLPEAGPWVVANNTGGMSLLNLLPSEGLSPNTGHRTTDPMASIGINNDPMVEIHIDHYSGPLYISK